MGDNNAVYVGGVWFAVNGWLTWALGELDGIVPHARDYAFDELVRNSLATHANVYPSHWDGVISVDDVCRSWYSTHPEQCGNGLSTAYDTQIMHQPAWSLFDVIKLAGVDPTRDGYRVVPHLPMSTFSLRLPEIGVAQSPGVLRGYVRPEQAAVLRRKAAGKRQERGRSGQVPAAVEGGLLAFNLPSTAGQPADWAVAAPGASVPGGGASGRCASRRDFRIRLGPRRRRLRRAAVYVNGRRVRVIRGRRLRAPVDLRGLLQGIVHVRILEVTRNGRRVTRRRTYHTCIPRLPRRRRRR